MKATWTYYITLGLPLLLTYAAGSHNGSQEFHFDSAWKLWMSGKGVWSSTHITDVSQAGTSAIPLVFLGEF